MYEATLTSKSQLTLPKIVRDAMGVGSGDRIRFVPSRNGFRVVAIKGDVRKLRSLFKGRNPAPVTIEAMNETIAKMGGSYRMIGLDTNVLVRYVAQDDPAQSRIVAKTLDTRITPENPGFISIVTAIELVWVLQTNYGASRADISTTLDEFLSDARFILQHEGALWRALEEFGRQTSTDFADALICALGQEKGCSSTLTFDKKAARIEGMELI